MNAPLMNAPLMNAPLMNDGESCEIRAATRSQRDMVIDGAAGEGWNPGLDDGECFHAADPEGDLVGCLNRQPVAFISAVRHGLTPVFETAPMDAAGRRLPLGAAFPSPPSRRADV